MDQRIGSAFVLEDDRQTARKASQRNGKDEIGPRRASKGASDRFAGKAGQGGETGLPLFPGPADPLIAGRDLPCGGPETQAGERGLPGPSDVADLGSGKGLLTDFPGSRRFRSRRERRICGRRRRPARTPEGRSARAHSSPFGLLCRVCIVRCSCEGVGPSILLGLTESGEMRSDTKFIYAKIEERPPFLILKTGGRRKSGGSQAVTAFLLLKRSRAAIPVPNKM